MWLEPCRTSGYPPPAAFHGASILFQTPSASVPPPTGSFCPPCTTNWWSPSGASSAMPAAFSSATVSARARPIPGAAWLSVRGVRAGSAAENGTSHRSLAAVVAVSFRQNRSKSSAPRLAPSAVRSQAASTPQAAETSTTAPSPPVAVPPGRAAQAFAASAAARSPAGTRFANCCSCRSRTVSPPSAAIAETSSSAPRVRRERGVATLPQIRS